ncbi:carboxylesterase 1C [Onthophagus taurus]|uniref:carboxylesterase 1C n=1 Tax=Onthophagus taurus TaxID=166361 RepID=UPI0039BE0F21
MLKTLLVLPLLISFRGYLSQKPLTVDLPKQGVLQGKEISRFRTEKIHGFLGIPYAKPPLGEFKFAPPQTDDLPSWDDVRNATDFAPSCLQVEKMKESDEPFFKIIMDGKLKTDEDCLYLNVYVPSSRVPTQGYPTIVWIHPGSFVSGSPNIWNPFRLVLRYNVIVVTIAYRLNIMGFFTTGDGEAPGNFGLMDQRAAITWVKENINHFGGDPENICLMGYGAGATSIGLHLINLELEGLFSSAIIMGGSLFKSNSVGSPKVDDVLDKVGVNHGCIRKPTSLLMQCLRNIDSKLIVEENQNHDWKPTYDKDLSNSTNPIIPENVRTLFERGEFIKVPLLTGYTNMEDALMVKDILEEMLPSNGTSAHLSAALNDYISSDFSISNDSDSCSYNSNHLMDSVMFFYSPTTPVKNQDDARKLVIDFLTDKNVASSTFLLATYMSTHRPTYVYRFDMKPSTEAVLVDLPDWISVPHLFDLLYVWGAPYWVRLSGNWDNRDRLTADVIMTFWTNFAKHSNPMHSSPYPIKWDAFVEDNPGILLMDRTYVMSTADKINYKSFQFWNDYFPKVLSVATTCCNPKEDGQTVFRSDVLVVTLGISFTLILN